MTSSLDQRFADAMGQLLGPDFPTDIGLAVSGGGDSMAMLTLAHNWARVWGVKLWVVTVDHGLREESAAEAQMVKNECAALNHPHCTLTWHWDGVGNLQSRARDARLSLIDRWRGDLRHVLMAHTQDDVAETFLTRLSRQAGVEGLSQMRATRPVDFDGELRALDPSEFDGALPAPLIPLEDAKAGSSHYEVVRPCLDMGRVELRHYLKTLQGQWVDDPSNNDAKYHRVQMRNLLPVLNDAGFSSEKLAMAARRMARASEALRARAVQVFAQVGEEERHTGDVTFKRIGFSDVERDTQLRLLSYAVSYVSSQTYRPREEPLEALLERVLGGGGGTLHGCEVIVERESVRVFREFNAVRGASCIIGEGPVFWDGRWRVTAPELRGKTIRALGEGGWSQVENNPEGGPVFQSARSLPSVWEGGRLLACDAMGVGCGGTTWLHPMGKEVTSFTSFILSH